MDKTYKVQLFFVAFLILYILFPVISSAQPIDPGCDPADPACPIDGGLSLLIATGIGLGAKKVMRKK
jgi:hypothetical protein